ncbi:hypothetical protein GCM10022252_28920 [Streptosporangium oxazolinicum]|uniref:Uncharacterized protein n=1 Tax=Streptosporangium oxazolinicum TaxID=909287 RepID=A0ABP8ATZ4_9ACTN
MSYSSQRFMRMVGFMSWGYPSYQTSHRVSPADDIATRETPSHGAENPRPPRLHAKALRDNSEGYISRFTVKNGKFGRAGQRARSGAPPRSSANRFSQSGMITSGV